MTVALELVKPVALPKRGWRYVRNLILAGFLALVFSFYVVVPIYTTYTLVHLRRPVCCVDPAEWGLSPENVTFTTADGLKLSAWYVPSRNSAAVMLVHGSNGNRTGLLNHAAMFARQGYGVLLLDLRGHGNSGGELFTLGWDGDKDLDAAASYLNNRSDVQSGRIGALGLSMGGEVVLLAAVHSEQIKAVVADGAGPRTVQDFLLMPGGGKWLMLPFVWTQFTTQSLLTGVIPPMPMDELLPRIAPRPLLLIAGGKARGGGEAAFNRILYEAAQQPKTLWEIPEAGHTGGLETRMDEYATRVVGFFNEALLK